MNTMKKEQYNDKQYNTMANNKYNDKHLIQWQTIQRQTMNTMEKEQYNDKQ